MKIFLLKFNEKPLFILFFLTFFSVGFSYSQLQVSPNSNAVELANKLIDTSCIKISNIKMQCPALASGTFNQNTSGIGIPEGILLTTGSAVYAIGPNNNASGGSNNGTTGDGDLDSLVNPSNPPITRTYDACVLEFDLKLTCTDTFEIQYVFGSEEYLEFVGSTFSDVFGIFLRRTGISNGTITNLAKVPMTNENISTNTIHGPITNTYPPFTHQPKNQQYYIDNPANSPGIQYDGFTKPITSKIHLGKVDTFHLKIAIGDVDDGIFDSGLFIKGHSGIPLQVATISANSNFILFQNEPNPFSGNTAIPYFLPDNISGKASIVINDIYGREIKKQEITKKGFGKMEINTGNLATGIYAYSLLIDGNIVTTKKMIRGK